ncbi:MAG: adenylyltransferase/cytidyltransferase family protein [Elusimicrobia bacterium]|nr:adenylyltransferase/cytidyltransferase family protein [Elusimicrobiota bacterium]
MTPRTVVTVGTFDGVHRGHQRIIHRTLQLARLGSLRSVVVTFPVSPRYILNPGHLPQLLTDISERQALLSRMGVEQIHVLPFTPRLAAVSAETFFHRFLVRRYRTARIVVGYNFGFGQGRLGNVRLLRRLGKRDQITVHQVGPVRYHHETVSSQRIRELIRSGAVEEAAEPLGYPYSVAGTVVAGRGYGTRLGFPTANLRVHPHKLLPLGVFGVRVLLEDETPPRVMFLFRVRSERRFPDALALKRQIHQDITICTRRLPDVTARLYKTQAIY